MGARLHEAVGTAKGAELCWERLWVRRGHCGDGCVTAGQAQDGMRSAEGGCETFSKGGVGEDLKFLYLSSTEASSSGVVKPEHLRASSRTRHQCKVCMDSSCKSG